MGGEKAAGRGFAKVIAGPQALGFGGEAIERLDLQMVADGFRLPAPEAVETIGVQHQAIGAGVAAGTGLEPQGGLGRRVDAGLGWCACGERSEQGDGVAGAVEQLVALQHPRRGGAPEGNGIQLRRRHAGPHHLRAVGPPHRHRCIGTGGGALQIEHQRLGEGGALAVVEGEAEIVQIPAAGQGSEAGGAGGYEPQQIGVGIDLGGAQQHLLIAGVDAAAIHKAAGIGIPLHRRGGTDQAAGTEAEAGPHGCRRGSAEIEEWHLAIGQQTGDALKELIAQLSELQAPQRRCPRDAVEQVEQIAAVVAQAQSLNRAYRHHGVRAIAPEAGRQAQHTLRENPSLIAAGFGKPEMLLQGVACLLQEHLGQIEHGGLLGPGAVDQQVATARSVAAPPGAEAGEAIFHDAVGAEHLRFTGGGAQAREEVIELHRLPHQPGWRRQRPGSLEQAWKGCAEGGFEAAGAATGQLAQQGSGRLATGIQIKGLAEQAFDRLRPFRPQLAEPNPG